MKFVLDSNILFTYFWENALIHKIKGSIDCYAPEFALQEIEEHKQEIKEKAKLSEELYQQKKNKLKEEVCFISTEKYKVSMKKAEKSCPDKDDIDFVALAIHMNCPLWTNDARLKQVISLKVFSTKELIGIVF